MTETSDQTAIVERLNSSFFGSDADIPPMWKRHPEVTKSLVRRFAVAYAWNETKTAECLKETLEWRKSYGTNSMAFLPSEILQGYEFNELKELYDRDQVRQDSQEVRVLHQMHRAFAGTYYKWDKEGHPIWIERTGRVDCQRLVQLIQEVTPPQSTYVDEVLRVHVMGNELGRLLCLHNSLKFKKNIDKMSVILDLNGLGWHQLYRPALEIIKGISALDQTHYPECMNKLYLVNGPTIATAFWKIIKYWLNERTQSKIQFLGADYQSKLLEDIDADCLPEFLGGTCSLEVPFPTDSQVVDDSKAIKSLVPAGGQHEEKLALKEGEVSCWEFTTEKYDLAYGVYFQIEGQPKPMPIIPEKRVDSHKMKITGDFTAPAAGSVILKFDNSFSRMTGKQLVLRFYSLGDAKSLETEEAQP